MVPDFITHVQSGTYAGVSAPCIDLQQARNSAVSDIVRQILGSINAEYNHFYESKLSGNPQNPKIRIQDDFSRVSSGIVLDVERNIVKSSYSKDASGYYISFILVWYPDSEILEMRRLSKGPNIVGSVHSESRGILRIIITETNGVAVTLASANIKITKKNRFARFYRFCIWKVPLGSDYSSFMALDPIQICRESSIIKLDLQQTQKNWKDYLLGAKFDFKIKLNGFDELGKSVSTTIKF